MNHYRRTNKQQQLETIYAKERKNKAEREKLLKKRKQLKREQNQDLTLDR